MTLREKTLTWGWMTWASYQMRKIAGCACAGNAGNVSPPQTSKETASWWSRDASRHVRHARAVMHVGIANPWWREKRSRHSRRMRNLQFKVSGKRPMDRIKVVCFALAECVLPWEHNNPRKFDECTMPQNHVLRYVGTLNKKYRNQPAEKNIWFRTFPRIISPHQRGV